MVIFTHINTTSRARRRRARNQYDEPIEEIHSERKKRESNLTEEERNMYEKELDELGEKLDSYFHEIGLKDGESRSHIYLREVDFIIGKYLGHDVREYPDYKTILPDEISKETDEKHIK